ncbi:hypothetical protein BH23GEM9_BH23GEM9_00040 [soil metagenome]
MSISQDPVRPAPPAGHPASTPVNPVVESSPAPADRGRPPVGRERLQRYLGEVEAIRLDARAVVGGLTADQFNWSPSPKRWSVGQCIEHLTLTARLYPARIEAMIEESRQREARGERAYREGVFKEWFIHSMEPPPKLRVRTMSRVEPRRQLEPDAVLLDFDGAYAILEELMTRADGVSLVHARMPSPFVSMMHFTLGQVFALNLAHARRHLWQAWQVRSDPGFPQS